MRIFSEKVESLFGIDGEKLASLVEEYNDGTSKEEKNSWKQSLPKLLKILEKANLGNLYLTLEYLLPAGGRIDAILSGTDKAGKHKALIIELKQWSRKGVSYGELNGIPCIQVKTKDSYFSRHPVDQTKEYYSALRSSHSNILNGKIELFFCQFLHEFECEEKEAFFLQALFSGKDISCMFCKGEEEKFFEFLKSVFDSDYDGKEARDLFLEGEFIITELDMEIINKISEAPENIPMLHDQYRIIDSIKVLLEKQAKGELKEKHLVVVSGAAGTGKTIVGFRILADYWKLHREKEKPLKCEYSFPQSRTIKQVLDGLSDNNQGIRPIYLDNIRSRLDLLVIDEAHRVTDFTKSGNVMKKAQIIVILQDDRQRVRGDEIGTKKAYQDFAKKNGYMYSSAFLIYQKRAGLGSYVERIDKLLYGEDYKIDVGLGLELKVHDTLKDFEGWVQSCYQKTKKVKYFASYCWEWKSRNNTETMDIVIEEKDYRFEKQWNPMYYQYDWYLDSIDMVGCIYTAQGLGFDYVGFIWWDDLVWRKDHWEFHLEKVTKNDYQLKNSIVNLQNRGEILLNIYRVMLTRAKKGIAIWFKDEETKRHFKEICLKEAD